MGGNGSKPWDELSGSKDWNGLLDPLNDDLRMYIIHYGERVQAIGDAYNDEKVSPGYRYSRFPMDNFFSYVGLDTANNPFKYKVTQFFYASSQLDEIFRDHSWIGYVAVSTDESSKAAKRRDILIAWRGTLTTLEGVLDITDDLVSAPLIFNNDHGTKVHHGWYSLYTTSDSKSPYTKKSARDQVLAEVRAQVDLYQHHDEEISITVTGHSMGGSLATLNALDIVLNGYNKPTNVPEKICMVTVFAFASPKVGDENFKAKFESTENLHALRIINAIDVVPLLPPLRYYHVGEQLVVDSRKSPYLKSLLTDFSAAIGIAHQLEPYLHLVAGTEGVDSKGFNLHKRRQPALVNKQLDALNSVVAEIDHVPPQWWVAKNKDMVQNSNDGTWTLSTYIPPAPVEKTRK